MFGLIHLVFAPGLGCLKKRNMMEDLSAAPKPLYRSWEQSVRPDMSGAFTAETLHLLHLAMRMYFKEHIKLINMNISELERKPRKKESGQTHSICS